MLPGSHEWVSKCYILPMNMREEKKKLSAKENERMSCYGEVAYRSELNQGKDGKHSD